MREALWVVGIGVDGRVMDIRLLLPGRVVRLPGAGSVLELPASIDPPPIDGALSISSG